MMLLTVIQMFIHDPLIEWTRPVKIQQAQPAGNALSLETKRMLSASKGEASEAYRYIEDRLNGHIVTKIFHRPPTAKALALPLSVESQVDQLIQIASSEENLCKMFIGWCAFV